MRFVLAIVSFVLAFVLIGYGVAQRTILAGPDHLTASVTTHSQAALTVIDGKTLKANPGHQTLEISGDGKVFAAYGRTADVHAWVGDSGYNRISYNADKQKLVSKFIKARDTKTSDTKTSDSKSGDTKASGTKGDKAQVIDPHGSDLWLEERSGDPALQYTMNVPKGISVIIASDGKGPAPAKLAVSWPLDNRTPWSGPLVVIGALMLLVGLGLYLWALHHLRKGRGPRRKSPKMPKVPKQRRYKPRRTAPPPAQSGRRRSSQRRRLVAVLPVLVIVALGLSGCSADAWPTFLGGASVAPLATPTVQPDVTNNQQDPAVTLPQLKHIVAKVSVVAAKADETKDAALLATRFSGPALRVRKVNYEIRAKDSSVAALRAIPQGVVEVALPQQSDVWPRTVFAVLVSPKDKTVSPVALMLEQATPRANYKVSYAMGLEAKVVLPKVASAAIGAPRLQEDSKLLLAQPNQLAEAYGDLLLKGKDSKFAKLFDTSNDAFFALQGFDAKEKFKASLPDKIKVTYSNAPGDGQNITFGTNDSGAIVAVNLVQTETVMPTEAGASLNSTGLVKTLSDVNTTLKGLVSTYGDQLLFYVPKAGSNQKIVLLGDADGIISAKEKS